MKRDGNLLRLLKPFLDTLRWRHPQLKRPLTRPSGRSNLINPNF